MIDTPALDGVSIMRRISLKQEVAFKEEVLSGQLVAQLMSDRAIKPRDAAAFTSGTVSSEHPRIRPGFTAV
jgi:hypothetical protein